MGVFYIFVTILDLRRQTESEIELDKFAVEVKIVSNNMWKTRTVLKIMLLLCMPMSAVAKESDEEKEFRRYIEALDVPVELRNIESGAVSDFWMTLRKRNMQLYELENNIAKMGSAEKKALTKISGRAFHPQYTRWVDGTMQAFCDSISDAFGLNEQVANFSLHVADMDEAKAFPVLKENDFAVCVTRGLLEAKGLSHEMLVGAIVSSYVHGLYKHPLARAYKLAKREQRNNTLATIGDFSDAFVAGLRRWPYYCSYFYVKDRSLDRDAWKKEDLYRYSKKYDLEQSLEADLAAYRFMELLGYDGENYIDLLRLLEANETLMDEMDWNDDSPTFQYRVRFITYVRDHPEITNTKNREVIESLQQKKLKEIRERQAP